MSIRVAIHHRTRYRYDRRVSLSPQIIRLRPAAHSRTPIVSYSLRVTPGDHFLNWQQDPHGNYLARLVFPKPVNELLVDVDVVADMVTVNPFDFFLDAEAETIPFAYAPEVAKDLVPYLEIGPADERLLRYVDALRKEGLKTVDYLVELNQRLQKDVKYLIRLEHGVQSPDETLRLGSGSCRDSAWLFVQVLRRLGMAARFVSGYLVQLTPDIKPLDGPAGPPQDFTDLHAWTEVFLPGAGWVGLDPTSGLFAGEGHIPLACTPEPLSAAPISGAVEKCETEFAFDMSVRRVLESPRVTLPYSDEQWASIDRVGDDVDASLVAADVRLSMGGEPTFVSIDDMDGEEWNTAALGPAKRKLGEQLTKRLYNSFAKGGLLHFGQGKWYPGEPLPRWAFSCYWRKDGEPIWTDPALFDDTSKPRAFDASHAQTFIDTLAYFLSVNPEHITAGFEDVWYYLWRERRLPANVDPFESNLKEAEERERLAKIFEQGLNKVVGYALPIQRIGQGTARFWKSGPWFFRTERMYLLPGDSPMGFRLPLDSLPWVTEGDYPYLAPIDPMAPRAKLPTREILKQTTHTAKSKAEPVPAPKTASKDVDAAMRAAAMTRGASASWVTRTAIVVEPRQGHIHVFMPPAETLEDYLSLVTAVEETAKETGMPVIIEGYPPPHDDRLSHVKVTPDPGVIEVNVHPAHSWRELVDNTATLYEDARQCRLGTEKFMVDGRHTGTGGGNHVVLGGATPADSPFLRRPDLLGSFVSYWHNHPSLSYLFSSLFIGPTSQAPRVDEARNDALFELEVALQQVPVGQQTPPWLVDRIFRNILTDLTGNTHRAEFCIDKLFSPDSPSGRQGLVEMRALEMPPHSRMSLAQQLLIRALVATFWKEPYRKRLSRWGTELHDKFMLPHFVWQDFQDVIFDLRNAGFDFQTDWFAPHLEFRFPKCGEIVVQGMRIELRQALEPWHVLGEEATAGGTARYVDSSVERLQVKVSNMNGVRHSVVCNGQSLPLFPSGVAGEFVAGVRFRAWQPPNCLHPTIGIHSPLVFDLHDGWNGRSVGGCTYHVTHPGGRSYSTFPVNALEAESRRIARFFAFGHTPGPMRVEAPKRSVEFPMTLDLRQQEG